MSSKKKSTTQAIKSAFGSAFSKAKSGVATAASKTKKALYNVMPSKKKYKRIIDTKVEIGEWREKIKTMVNELGEIFKDDQLNVKIDDETLSTMIVNYYKLLKEIQNKDIKTEDDLKLIDNLLDEKRFYLHDSVKELVDYIKVLGENASKLEAINTKIAAASEKDKKELSKEKKTLEKEIAGIKNKIRKFVNSYGTSLASVGQIIAWIIAAIIIIIGIVILIGVIVGFIYAYHAESMLHKATGEWSWGRIAKRSFLGFVYVAQFVNTYGAW